MRNRLLTIALEEVLRSLCESLNLLKMRGSPEVPQKTTTATNEIMSTQQQEVPGDGENGDCAKPSLLSSGGKAVVDDPESQTNEINPWNETYYLEGGFRRVAPYYYTYRTFCKERWRGRGVYDIFSTEFRDRAPEYYRQAIEDGKLLINGNPAQLDTVVKNGDLLSHTLHRHEPPVTSLPIGLIYEDENMAVIDKPPGVPVHPAGRYFHNSLTNMIQSARQWKPHPANRLDRLTSGVMFFGKCPQAAEEISQQLRDRTVQKEYIARVKGRFPDGIVMCDQPILKISHVLGLNRVRANGKDAKTKFRRLAYYPPHKPAAAETAAAPATTTTTTESSTLNERPATPPLVSSDDEEGYSIVHCFPLTGRTHQIRVHLQYLGHPITNDPIYSNRRVFGDRLGKEADSGNDDEDVIHRLSKMGKEEVADALSYQTLQAPPPTSVTQGDDDPDTVNTLLAHEHGKMVTRYLKKKGERRSGLQCETCGTELYTDPGVHELGIFLHAVSYSDKAGSWKYRSKMPLWAMPPPGMDGPRSAPDWTESEEGNEITIGKVMVDGEQMACVEGLGSLDLAEAAHDKEDKAPR